MAQQIINTGETVNSGTGESLRNSFTAVNENFTEIYTAGPVGSNVRIVGNAITTTVTNQNLVLRPSGIGAIQANATILPGTASVYNLGSPTQRFQTIHADYIYGNVATTSSSKIGNGTSNVSIPAVNGNVTVTANGAVTWTFDTAGNLSAPGSISAVGNIIGSYIIGNGALLTGLPASYSNANVASYLASGNNTSNIITTGNISGSYILGNGALLTGVITTVANINNGTSNVAIATANGNVAVAVNGTSNVAIFATTGAYISGVVSVGGNVTAGNISATSHTGTVISVSGNIAGGNIATSGLVSAVGNISGNYFIGNGSQLSGISSNKIYNGNSYANIATANGNVVISAAGQGWTFDTSGNLSLPGAAAGENIGTQIGYITVGNLLVGSGGSLFNTNNDIWALYGNLSDPGVSITIPSNAAAANSVPLNLTSFSNVEIISGGTWTFDTAGALNFPGGGQIYPDGAYLVMGGNGANASLISSDGNNYITTENDQIQVYISGNRWSFNSTNNQLQSTGSISITGSVSAGAGNFSNVSASGTILAAGNISATNIFAGVGTISTGGNIIGGNLRTGGTVSASGGITTSSNISAGNVSTSGNVTGGNLLTGGLISASGSITTSSNISAGNVSTSGNVIAGVITTSAGSLSLNPVGNVTLNNKNINNLADPAQAQDAATKSYVDAVAQGIHVHQPANLASTSDLATWLNISSGNVIYTQPNGTGNGTGATLRFVGNSLTALDGVSVTGNMRLLIKNQANAVTNGVYSTTANLFVITRSIGEDVGGELDGGDFLFVTTGNVNADSGWIQTTDNVVIGTSNVVFQQFSGAGTYSANTQAGLVLVGTQFSAKTDNISTAFDGTGNIVVKAGAVLTTPNIGAATGTSVSTTGNVTSGNLLTGGLISASGNITGTSYLGTVVSVTGNVTAGNVTTGGFVSATGNVTAGNVLAAGLSLSSNVLSAINSTSNITTTGNILGGNLLAAGLSLSSNVLSAINSTSNITTTGNISGGNLLAAGLSLSSNVISNLNVSSNIAGGNILTNGLVSVTGNITGGNISATSYTGSVLSVTGNITTTGNISGGNVLAAGLSLSSNVLSAINSTSNITTTGNISGGNISGTIIASSFSTAGNITGGNLLTAGIMSSTGNVTSSTVTSIGTGQNLIFPSNTFASWTINETALTGSQSDPFGGSAATLLVPSTNNTYHYLYSIGGSVSAFTAGAQFTISFYVKASGYTLFYISDVSNGRFACSYDLSAVTATPFSGCTGTITAVSGAAGWYRLSLTTTGTPPTSTSRLGVTPYVSGATLSNFSALFTGNGTSGAVIYGAQVEFGTTVGTYIATTASAVYGTPALSFSGVANLALQSNGALTINSAGATSNIVLNAGNITTSGVISTTGNLAVGNGVTGTIVLGDGTVTKTSGSPWTFNGGLQSNYLWATNGAVQATAGNASAPAFQLYGTSGLGVYFPTTSSLAVTVGSASVATFTSNGISVTGNIISGNLNASGLSLSGNVLSDINSTSNITTTGNITGGNLITTGNVSTTGNLTVGNLITNANIVFGTANAIAFLDNVGNTQFRIANTTANSVNYAQITGAPTNNGPEISAQGSDPSISINYNAKNAGNHLFRQAGGVNFRVGYSVTAAVNNLAVTGSLANAAPSLYSQGTDANISMSLQSKGTGGSIDLQHGNVSGSINIGAGSGVTAVTRTAAGSGYTSFPSLAISAPTTAGGVQATANIAQMGASAATVQSGGTGYTNGDVLTLVGGTPASAAATFTVTGVTGNVITSVSSTNFLTYTVLPTNPVSVTGGTGTLATLNVTYYVQSIFTITNAGSGYVEQPTVTFSGGGGSGAAAYATVGSNTTIKSIGNTIQFATPAGVQMQILDSASSTPTSIVNINGSTFGIAYVSAAGSAGSSTLLLSSKGTSAVDVYTNSTGSRAASFSHTASAVNYVQVTGAAANNRPVISAQGSDANVNLTLQSKGAFGFTFQNSLGATIFAATHTNNSSQNYLQLVANLNGSAPYLTALGPSDANIDLSLVPKGTGNVTTPANIVTTATTVSTSNATGSIRTSGGIGATGNVYIGSSSVYGYSNASSVSAGYTTYNAATSSIDMVFG